MHWIHEVAGKEPGVVGAAFTGSINWREPGDTFPVSSDIDISLVFEEGTELRRFGLFNHKGLIFEVGANPISRFDDIDALLADYRRSPNLWKGGVVLDRTGRLTEVQNRIQAEFTQPRWVERRIEDAVSNSLAYVDRMSESAPLELQALDWAFAEGVMCHVLLTGGLRNPTVRRRYSESKHLMESVGKPEVHEQLLEMFGCADMSVERVRYHFDRMTEVFDLTKSISGTPFPNERDIAEVARPLAVNGTDEQIRAGEHRESVYWIVVTLGRCLAMLRHVESEHIENAESALRNVLADVGISTWRDFESQGRAVRNHLDDLRSIALEMSDNR